MSSNRIRRKVDPNLSLKAISAKTQIQKEVFKSEKNAVLHGSAGTGKTFITSHIAYKAVLERKEYEKVIYIRSAVPTRNLGFLPGTEQEKVQVYEQPYREIAAELFDRGDAYELLKASEAVKFTTTSNIRGITLRNCIVIVDECQNMTYQELDSIITRIGPDCRIFFCGDFYQTDLKDTGIREFYDVLQNMEEFDFFNFRLEDVVRSELVKSYLRAKYDKGNFQQQNLPTSGPNIPEAIRRKANLRDSVVQQSDGTSDYPELWPHTKGSSNDSDWS